MTYQQTQSWWQSTAIFRKKKDENNMPRKQPQKPKVDPGSVIDSVKTLVIEGIHLYEKIKPLFRRTKPKSKTLKPKGPKKNDSSEIPNS